MGRNRRTNAQLIERLRETANFERSSFGGFGWPKPDDPLPTRDSDPEVTDFIKRRTKLYRETWVNPLIDEIELRLCKRAKATA
jgi:hypothetical protein